MGSTTGRSDAGPVDQIVTPKMIKNVPKGMYVANWCWNQRIGPMQQMIDEWIPHRQMGADLPPEYGWIGAGLFIDAKTQGNPSGADYKALIYYLTKDHFRALRKSAAMEPIAKDIENRIHGAFCGDPDFLIYPDQLILIAGDGLPQASGDGSET